MTLTDAELNSPLWLKLLAHWNKELETLRVLNDGELDELKTAAIRGRIKQIKRDIEIGVTPKEMEVD